MDLFDNDSSQNSRNAESAHQPLAARMRPRSLDEITGQEALLGPDKPLRRFLESGRLMSALFWGPPGCGKTTIARAIASATGSSFSAVNAVTSNVAELRKIIEEASRRRSQGRTVLFVDEIHRFSKSQQDVLMPEVEEGVIILLGATTQNPSFSVNGPLLSRSMLFEMKPLDEAAIRTILMRALADEDRGLGRLSVCAEEGALDPIIQLAAGDARRALNALEAAVMTSRPGADGGYRLTLQNVLECCRHKAVYYDRDGDVHYDTISAFIKSVRGSDPDASLYWLAKMLHAGEDPRFIMRRLLILASEDIGTADAKALILAASGLQTLEFVGMPESQITLAHVTVYLAMAPKSNAAYRGLLKALENVKSDSLQEVPQHLRDSHASGSKQAGRGEGYLYPHDFPGHFIAQSYMPRPQKFYAPSDQGDEKIFSERLRQRWPTPPIK